jgi:hypothetical protein
MEKHVPITPAMAPKMKDRVPISFYLLLYRDHLESTAPWFHSDRKADIDVKW